MEVSTTVSRYKYLSRHPEERKKRAVRVNVTQIDFKHGTKPQDTPYTDNAALLKGLNDGRQTEDKIDARVYVVEDLSRAVIEAFGSRFDIDPHFFRGESDISSQHMPILTNQPISMTICGTPRPAML
jgi:hypothetical protein